MEDLEWEWIRYKDIYVLFLKPARYGYRELAKELLYQLYTREKPLTVEDLMARLGGGAALDQGEKNFVQKYIRKLKARGVVRVTPEGYIEPLVPALPVEVVRAAVELAADDLAKYIKKRSLKAYRRGERSPLVILGGYV